MVRTRGDLHLIRLVPLKKGIKHYLVRHQSHLPRASASDKRETKLNLPKSTAMSTASPPLLQLTTAFLVSSRPILPSPLLLGGLDPKLLSSNPTFRGPPRNPRRRISQSALRSSGHVEEKSSRPDYQINLIRSKIFPRPSSSPTHDDSGRLTLLSTACGGSLPVHHLPLRLRPR